MTIMREQIATELFVKTALEKREIIKLTADWKVDTSKLNVLLCSHLRESGIFVVQPVQAESVNTAIFNFINGSPEVKELRRKAEAAELKRNQSRHAHD